MDFLNLEVPHEQEEHLFLHINLKVQQAQNKFINELKPGQTVCPDKITKNVIKYNYTKFEALSYTSKKIYKSKK